MELIWRRFLPYKPPVHGTFVTKSYTFEIHPIFLLLIFPVCYHFGYMYTGVTLSIFIIVFYITYSSRRFISSYVNLFVIYTSYETNTYIYECLLLHVAVIYLYVMLHKSVLCIFFRSAREMYCCSISFFMHIVT